MINQNQKLRFTDEEMGLIKSLFSDDYNLIYLIRKVMFQFELTDKEREELKLTMTAPVAALIKKMFLPDLDPDAPLFQMAHINLSLGGDIKNTSVEGAWPMMRAKKIEIDYMSQQLDILVGNSTKQKIMLKDMEQLEAPGSQAETVYANVIAWNYLLAFIDSCLQQFKILAGTKQETVEETQKRLARNSAK
jgi:hypothetical protein